MTTTQHRERIDWDGTPVPVLQWGKDHWSTFAYVETRIVDHSGWVDARHLRGCNGDASEYPTRLIGLRGEPVDLYGHDDVNCLTDAVAAGFLEGGRATKRDHNDEIVALTYQYELTPTGHIVAERLRTHKAQGGQFREFTPIAITALHEVGKL